MAIDKTMEIKENKTLEKIVQNTIPISVSESMWRLSQSDFNKTASKAVLQFPQFVQVNSSVPAIMKQYSRMGTGDNSVLSKIASSLATQAAYGNTSAVIAALRSAQVVSEVQNAGLIASASKMSLAGELAKSTFANYQGQLVGIINLKNALFPKNAIWESVQSTLTNETETSYKRMQGFIVPNFPVAGLIGEIISSSKRTNELIKQLNVASSILPNSKNIFGLKEYKEYHDLLVPTINDLNNHHSVAFKRIKEMSQHDVEEMFDAAIGVSPKEKLLVSVPLENNKKLAANITTLLPSITLKPVSMHTVIWIFRLIIFMISICGTDPQLIVQLCRFSEALGLLDEAPLGIENKETDKNIE